MMQKMREQPSNVKMHFYFEMLAVWEVMTIAYGIKDEEELIANKYKSEVMENPEWIRELVRLFKEHWSERYEVEMERHSKVIQEIKARRQKQLKTNTTVEEKLSFEERIAQVEEVYKKERHSNPEIKKMVYILDK